MKTRSSLTAAAVLAVLFLTIVQSAYAAVSVSRAELKSGALRVEGSGATPNATITVASDSTATGRADASGAFRVETTGFVSSDCRATVGDGASSTVVTLSGCSTATTSPPPPPPPSSSTLAISETALPDGNVGTAYTAFLTATGGSGPSPYEWRLVSGKLPPSLSIMKSFAMMSTAITGTPSAPGTYAFSVQVRDGAGNTVTKSFSITIAPAIPLAINEASDVLRPGTVGASYLVNLFGSGGAAPYTWSLVAGALAPGLSLSKAGTISGTPPTAGTFVFSLQLADSGGQRVTRELTIVVGT